MELHFQGQVSLAMAFTDKFAYKAHHFTLIRLSSSGLSIDSEGRWFEHSVSWLPVCFPTKGAKNISEALLSPTLRKTIFSFSKYFEKMVFPKKLHWNMIFLVLSGRMIFLFPKNLTSLVRQKRKDDIS